MRNIHDETLAELREVADIGIGQLRKKTRTLTPISPVVKYSPGEIKELRQKLQLTQSHFGELLGVSLKTIQAWEAGTNKPNGTALRVFQVLNRDPNALDIYVYAESQESAALRSTL